MWASVRSALSTSCRVSAYVMSSMFTINQTFRHHYLPVSLEEPHRSHGMWHCGSSPITRTNNNYKTNATLKRSLRYTTGTTEPRLCNCLHFCQLTSLSRRLFHMENTTGSNILSILVDLGCRDVHCFHSSPPQVLLMHGFGSTLVIVSEDAFKVDQMLTFCWRKPWMPLCVYC